MTQASRDRRLDFHRPKVAILANPWAGGRRARKLVNRLVAALYKRRFDPILCSTREALSALAQDITRQQPQPLTEPGGTPPRPAPDLHCVIAAGGDGTLAEVLNRAPGVPVALLPLGHENLVARHFGITTDIEELTDTIALGRVHRLDLGRAGERTFSLMAGAGFDADVVHRLHRRRRGPVTHSSYALPIARALRNYRFPPITIEIDDTGERLTGAMVFLFNLPDYALGLPIAPMANSDDGLLDLCVFRGRGVHHLARHFAAVLGRRQDRLPDFQRRCVRRVRLSADAPVPLQTDGDPAGHLPVTIEILPRAFPLLLAPT